MGAAARQRRESDDAGVLAVLGAKPGEWWRFREVCEALPVLGGERVRSALTRLAMRGTIEQGLDGQVNHFHWRLQAPNREG